ncbi:MAG TPA: homoserine dehydrogenase [Microbacteriaceae bacterium]|nr:homoserine dehydrogenase [Microbacteriaceae bacterium]
MKGYRDLRVAILGAGSVGSQVARLILEGGDELAARIGANLSIAGIAVRDIHAKRDIDLPQELLTTDAESLVLGADIVVELMGGIEPARTLILKAIESGADVVTANKALIAEHGQELTEAAERVGAQLTYEAAVAGAIPILRPLRESLAGDHITRVLGIVNGSTNYILDRMDRFGDTAEAAAKVASDLGFLEADPSLDVEGYDAAQKATILASIAFHTEVPVDKVYREGITHITADHIDAAKQAGFVIKLLAIAERVQASDGTEGVSARVYPALIAREHPLAAVYEAKNAVFVEAEAAGELMFYGAGAGGVETASAVMGDLVSTAKRHIVGGPGIQISSHAELPILPIEEIKTKYLIMLEVSDAPGVLATVAGILAENGVSAASVEQTQLKWDPLYEIDPLHAVAQTATLVIGTHAAREAQLAAMVKALAASDVVNSVQSFIRVEGN